MNPMVWAFSENPDIANEISSAANELAGLINGDPLVIEVGELRKEVKAKSKLLLKGDFGPNLNPDVISEALSRAAKKLAPKAILLGATRNGREIAGELSAKLMAGCLSEAIALAQEGGELLIDRSVFSGKVVARVSSAYPAIATVKPGAFPRLETSESQAEEFDVGQIRSHVKVMERKVKEADSVDLKKAKVIVSAGRGIKKKEDLAIVEALAITMKGALGCSRPLSSDLGWLPEEHHIGLTGVTVKPDLYLAVGISGQLQHIAGMKDSKVVAAINTDKDAPIFQSSDYGIVGDLYQVVPAIQRAIVARR